MRKHFYRLRQRYHIIPSHTLPAAGFYYLLYSFSPHVVPSALFHRFFPIRFFRQNPPFGILPLCVPARRWYLPHQYILVNVRQHGKDNFLLSALLRKIPRIYISFRSGGRTFQDLTLAQKCPGEPSRFY